MKNSQDVEEVKESSGQYQKPEVLQQQQKSQANMISQMQAAL